uniref:F-box domain-containing protein n=1 Tax=Micromonas pusilla TaxID=38833 RepID=A0A7S0KI23_MICPS|mmetsp:Transcript_1622/g.6304  ORF Transcript_1622/g.6304 Transcript_1622/m.6304 type:complete len:170 (-) Transcript_1622:477-986(-)
MSALGSANSSAHGAAPLSTSPSDPENDTSVERRMIVHPRFFRQLKEEPAVFCPLDWLPDEVISNVLVHLHGRDVARFSIVNRRARRLCEDDDVWRELCARHFDIRPENRDRPECGWNTLYQIHHNVLYSLFRDGGRQSPGLGTSDGFGRGIAAIAQGRAGGMSISLGAA